MTAEQTTVDADEIRRFHAMADSWWDPNGEFKPLHQLNPTRLSYIRDQALQRFARQQGVSADRPAAFSGLELVDIGCGGGLISEPMTRLGFRVTGIDAGDKTVGIARAHADSMELDIDYRATTVEALAQEGRMFDVVLMLEIVEHVADIRLFVQETARLLRPGGLLIASTINRTWKSLLLAKIGAEYVLRWVPAGTHEWRKFVRPSELVEAIRPTGLTVTNITGMRMDPLGGGWSLDAKDLDVNYLLAATR